MKLSEITHKSTLKAINTHQISEEELEKFDDIKQLRHHMFLICNRKWQKANKPYFRTVMLAKYHSDENYRLKTIENSKKRQAQLKQT